MPSQEGNREKEHTLPCSKSAQRFNEVELSTELDFICNLAAEESVGYPQFPKTQVIRNLNSASIRNRIISQLHYVIHRLNELPQLVLYCIILMKKVTRSLKISNV